MKFWELPYEYVIQAVFNASKLRHRELHEYEVPISYLAYQQAEINRDTKKRKKPYDPSDFYCYPDISSKDSVDAIYGACASKLLELQMMPGWALFVYKELKQNASKAVPKQIVCYSNKSALILAPSINSDQCKGMLIALEDASHRVLSFDEINRDGTVREDAIRLRMPVISGKTVAIENCYVDVFG